MASVSRLACVANLAGLVGQLGLLLAVRDRAAGGVPSTFVALLLGFLAAGIAQILGGFLAHRSLPWRTRRNCRAPV
jgi:hypothetical protein